MNATVPLAAAEKLDQSTFTESLRNQSHKFCCFTKLHIRFINALISPFDGISLRKQCHRTCLKAELLEEPLVLSALVSVFEAHADLETGLLALDGIFQVLDAVFALKTDFWDAVTGWHQMVVVDELELRKR
jgi:hypothetical protein